MVLSWSEAPREVWISRRLLPAPQSSSLRYVVSSLQYQMRWIRWWYYLVQWNLYVQTLCHCTDLTLEIVLYDLTWRQDSISQSLLRNGSGVLLIQIIHCLCLHARYLNLNNRTLEFSMKKYLDTDKGSPVFYIALHHVPFQTLICCRHIDAWQQVFVNRCMI